MNIKNIKRNFKTWGIGRGIYYYLMVVLKSYLTFCQIHLRALNANSVPPQLEEGYVVRFLTEQELMGFCGDPELDLDKTFIKDAFARGDICVAVLYRGDVASYAWFAFGSAPHLEKLWVDFDRQYRYGYKAYTRPHFRKKKLQHAINLNTDKMMLERGISHGIGFIETHNYPSLISNYRRGNVRVGYAGYINFFGKIIPFRTRGAKKHGFRFYFHD